MTGALGGWSLRAVGSLSVVRPSSYIFRTMKCVSLLGTIGKKCAQGPKKALDITFSAIMSGVGTCLERADPLALER